MVKTPKNLLELPKAERQQFLDSFDTVLADCDGVVWTLTDGIPGASEGLQVLQEANKDLSFVSNNSVRSQQMYEKQFEELKIKFDYNQNLVHPAASIVSYLKKINFEGLIFLIGSSEIQRLFKENNFDFITAPDSVEYSSMGDFLKQILTTKPVKAVVFDVDLNLNLAKFYCSQFYLRDPECKLLFGATDPTYMVRGLNFAGMSGFMELLAEKTGRKAIVLGKPGADLEGILLDKYNIKDKKRVLFIGDTLDMDIGFANKIGFQTLLVLSGVTSRDMIDKIENPENIPDFYTNQLLDFVEFAKDLEIKANL